MNNLSRTLVTVMLMITASAFAQSPSKPGTNFPIYLRN